jgi:hypothetical protein
MNYFATSVLTRLMCSFAVSCIALALCIGGKGGEAGTGGAGITPNMRSMMNVFRAAPFNCSVCFAIEQSTHRKAPPPYVTVGAAMLHLSQLIPSSGCKSPAMVPSKRRRPKGGTTGSAPEITKLGACARVDVWLPESMRNSSTLQTPAINDPNASVTLNIKPPLEGERGDCTVWRYHYGDPPDNSIPNPPQVERIGGGRAEAGNQPSMPSILEAP